MSSAISVIHRMIDKFPVIADDISRDKCFFWTQSNGEWLRHCATYEDHAFLITNCAYSQYQQDVDRSKSLVVVLLRITRN